MGSSIHRFCKNGHFELGKKGLGCYGHVDCNAGSHPPYLCVLNIPIVTEVVGDMEGRKNFLVFPECSYREQWRCWKKSTVCRIHLY